MPIIKSAKKALRQNIKRRAVNIQKRKKLKSALKEVRNLISQKKQEEAKKLLPQVYKILDKSAKTNLIKKNTASRKKSRITKSLNLAQGGVRPLKAGSNPQKTKFLQ